MVKLPTIPRRFVTIEEPRQRISEGELAAPYRQLQRSLDTFADGLTDASVVQAEADAKKAVTRDADGDPSFQTVPLYSGAYGRVFNKTVEMAGATELDSASTVALAELRKQHVNDPAAFRVAAEAYRDRLLSKQSPDMRDPLRRQLDSKIAGNMASAVNERFTSDTARDKQRFEVGLVQADRDLTKLAEDGGVNTPEYRDAWAKRQTILETMTSDPRFNMTREAAEESMRQRFRDSDIAVISGDAKRQFNANGDIASTIRNVETLLDSKELSLSTEEKVKYRNRIIQSIQGSAAVRSADVSELKQRVDGTVTSLQNGELEPDDESVSGLIADARKLRQYGLAARLTAERTTATYKILMDYGTPADRAQAMQELREELAAQARGDEASSIGAGGGAAALLRRFEGFRETPYWDVNALRTGYGSDTITRADGSVERVSAGTVVSREDAERDLARRVREFEGKASDQVGASAWQALPDGARAALTSVAYNYGSLPNSVVEAVATGDTDAIASAVEGLQGHNAGVNRNRRLQEAAVIRGGAIPGGGADASVREAYSAAVRSVQKVYDDSARDVFTKIKAANDAGREATPDEITSLAEIAPVIGDADLRKQIKDHFTAVEGAKQIIKQGPAARQIIDGLEQAAAQGKAPPAARAVLDQAQKQEKQREALLKTDPSQAVQRWMPEVARPTVALDFSSPDALAAGIDARQRNVRLAQNWMPGSEIGGVFNGRDVEAIRQTLANGSREQAVSTLLTLTKTLSANDWRQAFDNAGLRDALVGMTTTGDAGKMNAAYTVLDHERSRNPLEFDSRFGSDTRRRLDDWTSRLATRTPEQIMEEQRRVEDPSARKAREDARKDALDSVKDVTPDQLVARYGWSFVPGFIGRATGLDPAGPASNEGAIMPQKMLNEWKQEYADYFVKSGDAKKAGELALKALQQKWRPSALAGGAIMEYPPDDPKLYPMVDGSYGWMREQADQRIRAHMLFTTGDAARFGGARPGALGPAPIDYRLLSDARTQADIAAGRPPSYNVVIQRDGRYELMMDGRDPYRIAFDPTVAQDQARARFRDAQSWRHQDVSGFRGRPEFRRGDMSFPDATAAPGVTSESF